MYESYGYPDVHGLHPQPETSMFWDRPENVQHPYTGQALGGTGMAHPSWDPVEDLAIFLQESAAPGHPERFPRDGLGDTASTSGWAPGLNQNAAERPPAPPSGGHRRSKSKSPVVTLLHTGSVFTAALVGAIAAVVSILSGLAICDALRHSAGPDTDGDVLSWWPLLIYGPWMVASLSILRSALHQRRALHSWSVVLLFSTLATLLCVAQAPRTIAAGAASALPAIAALACFQQLVRQITLTRPPRQSAPRHRNPLVSASVPLDQTAAARRNPGSVRPGYPAADNDRAVRSASRGHRFGWDA
ncbi:hypothetical protein ACFQ7O_31835 [Streptomyces sp. NPDC056485]|uniref:hypothetical protein n=1 Tax=Streptomyces sp. NPDC056485 TaxID=3345834 RepID=UPI0036B685A2